MTAARLGVALAAAAVLFAAAVPPFGVSPLAIIALAPLIWAVTRAPSGRAAVGRGALASLAVTLLVFHWLPGSVHAFFDLSPVWSWIVFPLYGLVGQPQLLIWALVRWRWRKQHGVVVMLASAAAYTGLDWLLPKLFHDTLGVAFCSPGAGGSAGWVIQVIDLGGIYLLTFVVMFTTELGYAVAVAVRGTPDAAARRSLRVGAAVAVAVWGAIFAYGSIRRAQITGAVAVAPTLAVGVVQANIGNIEKEMASRGDMEGIVGTLRTYGELSDRLATSAHPPELLLWPETAYPLAYGAHRSPTDDGIDDELATYVRQRKLPLLFGGYDRRGDVEFNSALLLTPAGELTTYHKRILIPFGEYIPLIGHARFGTGGTPRVIDVPRAAGATVRIAPLICYEALFTDHAAGGVADGARALVNLTNDSWFVSSAEKRLHLVMAALRSLETRRAQVRATNTGISALILPTGEIVAPGPEDQPAALSYAVPLLDIAATPVVRWGNWPGPISLALLAVLMLRARLRPAGPATRRRADR
jgi:apolipoprotein N-acyltransferase